MWTFAYQWRRFNAGGGGGIYPPMKVQNKEIVVLQCTLLVSWDTPQSILRRDVTNLISGVGAISANLYCSIIPHYSVT